MLPVPLVLGFQGRGAALCCFTFCLLSSCTEVQVFHERFHQTVGANLASLRNSHMWPGFIVNAKGERCFCHFPAYIFIPAHPERKPSGGTIEAAWKLSGVRACPLPMLIQRDLTTTQSSFCFGVNFPFAPHAWLPLCFKTMPDQKDGGRKRYAALKRFRMLMPVPWTSVDLQSIY
ncbi:MAG: hypothetical protein JWM08_125 [Candidatus Angelobacter sp.]|nr:hypothetical protein [Candidatus Angelobacter sp.]